VPCTAVLCVNYVSRPINSRLSPHLNFIIVVYDVLSAASEYVDEMEGRKWYVICKT